MKIAICAIIKNENLYLREWVEHHKNLGFDKIILYDNNPIDGEVPHQVVGDYVMSGFIDVHNIRGMEWQPKITKQYINHPQNWGPITIQQLMYTKCMLEYQKEYEWIAYIDVDEFIIIEESEPQNIHQVFDKYKYEKNGFKQIAINWYNISDDGKTDYENKPVQERFTKPCNQKIDKNTPINNYWVKSIMRTDYISPNDAEKKIIHIHANDVKTCHPAGTEIYNPKGFGLSQTNFVIYKVLVIKHYFSKSLWEHLSKQRNLKNHNKVIDNRISSYKELNGWNDDHEKVLQEYNRYINTPEDIEYKTKIAICAIIKNENLYLREWVEYHKNLGFDKIILYDNNPIDGEVPHQVIGDYVMSGFVDVHNIRGLSWKYSGDLRYPNGDKPINIQFSVYRKCMLEYQNEYQWISYIDADEFITIGKNEPQNIHHLFDKYQYEKKGFKQILMNWYNIGDDGKTEYENKPVQERFINHGNFDYIIANKIEEPITDHIVKPFIHTSIISKNDKNGIPAHAVSQLNIPTCNAETIPIIEHGTKMIQIAKINHEVLYVRHYFSKSLWEHLTKLRNLKTYNEMNDNRLSSYKNINGWNDDYEKILQNYISYINNPEYIE